MGKKTILVEGPIDFDIVSYICMNIMNTIPATPVSFPVHNVIKHIIWRVAIENLLYFVPKMCGMFTLHTKKIVFYSLTSFNNNFPFPQ